MDSNAFPDSSKASNFSQTPIILETPMFSQSPITPQTPTFSETPILTKAPTFSETPVCSPIEGSIYPPTVHSSTVDSRAGFLEAARNGHDNEIRALLHRKTTFSETNDIDHALREASASGHGKIVKMLLKAGAKIEARPSENGGRTALQAAAESGHTEIVSMLLKAGASIDAKALGYRGRTALQAAARGGHTNTVSALLKAGANVNAKPSEYNGRTALQTAAGRGHAEIVSILLKAGANVNAKPSKYSGRTALQAAAGGGYAEIVVALLEAGANIEGKPCEYSGKTALQAAIENEHVGVVTVLLDAGARVNPEYPGGTRDFNSEPYPESSADTTLLLDAVESGNADIVDKLIDKGADVNLPGPPQQRADMPFGPALPTWPLCVAAEKGHTAVVQILLSRGARTDAGSPDRTAIRAAAEAGHLDVIELLLGYGIDINGLDKRGRTCLTWAISHLEIIQMLLRRGANVDMQDVDGSTLLHVAAEKGRTDVVQTLLDERLDINARNKYGQTCLSWGISHPKMVQLLLEKGANTQLQAMDGATPLHHAVKGCHIESMVLLLNAGASIESEDYDHRKPLDIVLHGLGSSPKSKEVLKLLIKYGCDTGGRNMESWREILGAGIGDVIQITESPAPNPVLLSLKEPDSEAGGDRDDHSSATTHGPGDDVCPVEESSLGTTASEIDLSRSMIHELRKLSADVDLISAPPSPPRIYVPNSPDSPVLRRLYSGLGANIFFPAVEVEGGRSRFSRSNNSTSGAIAEWQWLLLDEFGEPSGYGLSNIGKLFTTINKQALLSCYVCFRIPSAVDTSSTARVASASGSNLDRTFKLDILKSEISWTMRKPRTCSRAHNDANSYPIFRSEDFRSTLDIGWIPGSGVEFFTMFISDLHEKWKNLLKEIHDHLERNFDRLLGHKGEARGFIENLLYDAQQWGKMQALLRTQVSTAKRLHQDFKDVRHLGSELESVGGKAAIGGLLKTIQAMEEDVGSEFQKITQTTKDMIQFELNLVSVHEARLSERLGMSMKRLSWITFFFLPLMFVASVFGMNIDVINGAGPHWTWVIKLSGSVFSLVILVWIFMKIIPIDKWLEENRGRTHAEKWKGISRGLVNGWQKITGRRRRGDVESGTGHDFQSLSREWSKVKDH